MNRKKHNDQNGSDALGGFPESSGGFPDTSGFSGFSGFPDTSGSFPDTSGSFPDTSGSFPDTSGGFPDATDSLFPGRNMPEPGSYSVRKVTRWDRGGLIHALVGALVGVALAILLYNFVLVRLAPPNIHPAALNLLMIASLVALLGLGSQLSLATHAAIRPDRLRLQRGWPARLAILIVALFALGALMQFLYSLGGVKAAEPADDFVFLIDDSGSMHETDPKRQRVESMEVLMQKLTRDNRIAMAFFNEDIVYSLPMEAVTDQTRENVRDAVNQLKDYGNTDVNYALYYALDMEGLDDGRVTELVLLTDGMTGYIDLEDLSKRCQDGNIRISAIVMDSGLNNPSLKKLTRMTGGALYEINRLDELVDAYSSVGFVNYNRDLLGLRSYMDHDSLLLGILRAFSWLLFGAAIGLGMVLTLDVEYQLPLLIGGPAAGLLLGIALEIANALWMDGTVFNMNSKALLTPVICVAILFYETTARANRGSGTSVGTGIDDGSQTLDRKEKDITEDWLSAKKKQNGTDILGKR